MPSLPNDLVGTTSVTLRRQCSGDEGGGVDTKAEVDLLVHSFPGLSSPSFLVPFQPPSSPSPHSGPAALLLGDSNGGQQALCVLVFSAVSEQGEYQGKCCSVLVPVGPMQTPAREQLWWRGA